MRIIVIFCIFFVCGCSGAIRSPVEKEIKEDAPVAYIWEVKF